MGCDPKTPEVIEKPYPVSVYVPDSVRSCPDIPLSSNYRTDADKQSEVAGYITELHRVARTCKANLDTVDGILADHEASVTEPSE